ncbi:RNA 3'-terminal phosphate cyclase [Epargyreus clarus]|uniref:RNA 3'-terminal phosphate cyclase n=1 Tax=Epargyreus clarus TaxID=520877 RepID=UPI003C2FECDE
MKLKLHLLSSRCWFQAHSHTRTLRVLKKLKSSYEIFSTRGKMSRILEIDGSVLEGGGQILRISVSLSAILGVPIRVTNIRAGRPKPGLAAQHLKGIQLVGEMCQARMNGAHIGSTEIEFIPGKLKGGRYFADTKTAGSISLLLQVALPCALMAPEPVTLELKGGTNAAMAPQIDYMDKIFRPALRKFGADFSVEIIKRGYYPRGGGHVRINISPVKQLQPVNLMERGTVDSITAWSFVSGSVNIAVAQRMAAAARRALAGAAAVEGNCFREDRHVARDDGFAILLMAYTSTGCVLGTDGLGARNVDPDELGCKAAEELKEVLDAGACVDSHAQDQLVVYMCLAAGASAARLGAVTLHTRTAVHVAQLLANVQFDIIADGEQNILKCNGIGIVNHEACVE